jgi:osmotically-inducible protein OsmY
LSAAPYNITSKVVDGVTGKQLLPELHLIDETQTVKDVKNELKVVTEPPRRSMGETIDDASVTAQVKAALLTHRSTSALRTKTETRDGVVTLSGEAANQAEKDLVSKLTRDVNGVKSVNNNMTLKA